MRAPAADLERVFRDFIARRELHVPRCTASGAFVGCGTRSGEVEWVKASGAATLYSFVVYRRQYSPDFPVPYNVALVELAEGPRLISTVIAAPEALRVGMNLRAEFEPSGRLVFRPI
jgi:uncharacterized OB-fold protein